MAVLQEIWAPFIMDNLFEGNKFLEFSQDHSSWVNNRVVHVPRAGGNPAVQIDRSVLPATVARRTDTEQTYTIREFTTDPVVITRFEEMQLSYSKRKSVMGQQLSTIAQNVGIAIANAWAPNTKKLLTSGAVSGTALAPGATGTRKAVLLQDIEALAAAMDQDNVPQENRYLLMPVGMYYQLFPVAGSTDISLISSFTLGRVTLPDGQIPQLFGFNIMRKPTVAVYDNTQTKKAVTAATAVTDNLGALAWHSDYVARAISDAKAFLETDRPEYYGDLFSTMVAAGGAPLRSDEVGTYALVQN